MRHYEATSYWNTPMDAIRGANPEGPTCIYAVGALITADAGRRNYGIPGESGAKPYEYALELSRHPNST